MKGVEFSEKLLAKILTKQQPLTRVPLVCFSDTDGVTAQYHDNQGSAEREQSQTYAKSEEGTTSDKSK